MTIVNVFLAICALETFRAMTLILIAFNRRTLSAVHARIWVAILHLHLAISSAIACSTLALKSLTRVAASASMLARLARTCYRLRLAMLANPSVTTLACVALAKATGIVGACAVVEARIDDAVFDFNLAVGAEKAGWTLACVRTLSGVRAGSAVVTRLVIGAEVQVLVAEQSTPALLADAFPLHIAGSMYTSWIHFTLVTIRSPVSAFASVDGRR